jgi:anti-anti-sigma factor
MNFRVENEEKYAVVVSEVEKLDTLSAPDLKTQFIALLKDGQRNIIVDLSQTRYCDSSGLSALLTGNRLCREHEGSFAICGLQPGVEKLIQISRLQDVFNITPLRNEAIDLVMMEEIERDLNNSEE